MPTVADVLRRYGGTYLQRFGTAMPAEHRKALAAIVACRTGQLGTVVYTCSKCGRTHSIGRSCGNRHCPTCQQNKTRRWLEIQTARLLPCPYFLLTFTLPEALRAFVRAQQRIAYAALFEASSSSIQTLAADPKYLGSPRVGFFGVLHTWGRTLQYHPHVHYVVPGGAVSQDDARWLPSRADFFVPVKALSLIFRARFRDILGRAGLLDQVDPAVWRQDWVVHSQAVGDGRASLQYLAPYVFRVAISDRRIVSYDEGRVTFTYRKSGTSQGRRMTLDALEFLRRFLQHVLPSGFQKVRHYGFLSSASKRSVEAVRWLVTLHNGERFALLPKPSEQEAPRPRIRCAECGGALRVALFLPARVSDYYDTS
jgi:hypothetical protein